MTARVCNKLGCPEIIEGRQERYCPAHKLKAWVKNNPRPNIPGWSRIRLHILHRDHNTCQTCGATATEVDHIIPLSRGGSSKPSNLQALCTKCNRDKNYRERKQ